MHDWVEEHNARVQPRFRYKCVSSPGSARSAGVAILFKPKFEVISSKRDDDGRLVVAELSSNNLIFQVMCLYAPNSKDEGKQFFESLYSAIDPDIPLLLCGDFNAAVDPYVDRFGCNPVSPWANNWASTHRDLMSTFDLCDAWRARHPGAKEFTWRRTNGSQGSRIDMIWLPERYLGLVHSVEISPFLRSDHQCVFLEIALPFGVERGPGMWKFNVSLLKNEAFCAEVEDFWCNWRAERSRFCLLSNWYEAGKIELRKLIRVFSRRLARDHARLAHELNSKLKDLEKRADGGENLSALLTDTRAELDAYLLHEAQGARLRAQVQEAEEGERSTSYFLRKEKVRGQQRLIKAVRRSDGSVATSAKDVSDVWRDFYFHLFSSQELVIDDQAQFLDGIERSLTPADSELCEGDLTIEECSKALSSMASAKSPGVDGFPAEFYRRFWKQLGPDLVDVYNFSHRQGRLPKSHRCGAITLLYKKGDCLDAANWRPITLLCADYKIAAKALANRLLCVIASVVSPDQTCGIPGRFSGENIRLLQDVADYANRCHIGGAIVSLDQEKAFDRVEISYMLKVLERMGFGPSFRRWIKLLYTDVYSAVSVNGFLTDYFPVTRGVRQGCPLSPLLYVLVMESLACAVRADIHIDGFPLPGGNNVVKISQYADDTSSLVVSDASLRALFAMFAKYESASGARLNQGKCCGLLLGPWRNRTSLPVVLKWSSSHIVVLGARISSESTQDWEPAYRKLEAVFLSWQRRHLSYRGRALVACVLGASRFWYLGSTVPVSSHLVSRLDQLLFNFVWNGKGEWLKRSSVTQPLSRGGLGVVNVASKLASLRVLWVKRFLVGQEHPWKCFFRHFLRRAFLAEPVIRVFNLRLIGRSTLNKLPLFYRQVLESWLALGGAQNSAGVWVVPSGSDEIQLSDLSSRVAYSIVVPQTEHRCVAKFAMFNIDWLAVWSDLELLRYDRPVWKTNWLAAHSILPTCDRISKWGVVVNNFHCHCGTIESQNHLFIDCPLARALIDWFEGLLGRFRPAGRNLSNAEIRFGFATSVKIPAGYKFILATLRHYVWVARNAWQFAGTRPDLTDLVEKILATFRFVSKVQQRNARSTFYEDEWLAGGVLGSLL
jgi:exonuclease III